MAGTGIKGSKTPGSVFDRECVFYEAAAGITENAPMLGVQPDLWDFLTVATYMLLDGIGVAFWVSASQCQLKDKA